MSTHLDDNALAAAVAGLELEERAREHMGGCLSCRRQVTEMVALIAERREVMEAEAPDWDRQRQAILDRLPTAPDVVAMPSRGWRRPMMAAAAAVLVTVAGVALFLNRGASLPSDDPTLELDVVLAEVEAAIDDDQIPGFGMLGSLVLGSDDGEEAADSSAEDWEVALAAVLESEESWEVPGFEAMGQLVPSFDDLTSLMESEAS